MFKKKDALSFNEGVLSKCDKFLSRISIILKLKLAEENKKNAHPYTHVCL
jgi:hypothetical protein